MGLFHFSYFIIFYDRLYLPASYYSIRKFFWLIHIFFICPTVFFANQSNLDNVWYIALTASKRAVIGD